MERKKILTIFRDQELPVEQELLENRELDVVNSQDEEKIADLSEKDFIFTNFNDFDYISDVHLIRKNKIKMISSENVLDMKTFIEAGGRAVIPPIWFDCQGVSNAIISRFFGEDASIHLDDLNEGTEITRYELFEHLKIGEISDELVTRAFAKGFNPVAVRDWVEHIVYFTFYLHQAGIGSVPVELSVMQNDQELTMSVSINAADLSLANFTNSFGHINPDYPLYSLLETARVSSHLFSIALYKDTEKINFTAYWNKDFEKHYQKEQCFLLQEIDASDFLEGERAHPIIQTLNALEEEMEQLEKESMNAELPGNIIELMASGAYAEENVQNVAEKVQEKIQEKLDAGLPLDVLEDEIKNIKDELLARDDAHLFEPFPELEEVAQHIKRSEFKKNDEIERIRSEHSEDEDILVKGQQILEDKLSQTISDNLEDEASSTFINGLMEELEEAQKILGSDDDDNAMTIVKGHKDNLEEEMNLVSSKEEQFDKALKKNFLSQIDNEDSYMRMKSSDFFRSEDFKKKISGSIGNSVRDVYKVKKINPETIKDIEESLTKSLQGTFAVSRDEAKQMIRGTFEELKKEEVNHVKSKLLDKVDNEEVKESYVKKSALKSLDQEKKKNEELKSQNQLLRAQVKSLQAQSSEKVDFQKKVKKQILEIEKRAKVQLNKQAEEQSEDAISVTEELLEVKQKMQLIQKEFQIKNEQLQKKLHEHESKSAAQEILLSKTREEHIKKLSQKEKEIVELKEQVKAALKNVNYGTDDDAKKRIEKLEIEKRELNSVIDAQKNDIRQLENKYVDERDKRLDERAVKNKINRLEKENSAAQAMINRLRKEMGQSHKVVDKQQMQITDFRQIKASDNSELSKLKQVNRNLELKIKDLENKSQIAVNPEVESLKQATKQWEKKYQILEQKNHQLSSKLEKQRKVATQAPKKDPTQDIKIQKLEQAQRKLTKDLANANNQLALSKKEAVKFKNKENALNLKISQLEKELDKVKKSAA